MADSKMYEVVEVGEEKLVGEVIKLFEKHQTRTSSRRLKKVREARKL